MTFLISHLSFPQGLFNMINDHAFLIISCLSPKELVKLFSFMLRHVIVDHNAGLILDFKILLPNFINFFKARIDSVLNSIFLMILKLLILLNLHYVANSFCCGFSDRITYPKCRTSFYK